jgi:predicted nucleic acid-binding protein
MSAKTRTFLDTNILVYQFDLSSPTKQKQAIRLINELLTEGSAAISSQVVQEFLNVALKKFSTQLPTTELDAVMDDILVPLCSHYPSIEFYQRALKLFSTNSLNLYDALIIQAAIDLGCDILYSEDLQDGQQFGKLRIVNPFK